MENRKDNREGEGWPKMGPHDKFLGLCAISTSGDLTEEEQEDLQAHLAECADCRQALKEFEAAVDIGVPLLHSQLSSPDSLETSPIPTEVARATPTRVTGHIQTAYKERESMEQSSGLRFSNRNGHRQMQINWNYVWMPFAAAVVLTVALGIYSFQVGKHKGQEVVSATPNTADTRVDALEQRISDAGHEREVLRAQLVDRDRVIAELRRRVENQSAALNETKSAQISLEQSLLGDKAEKQQVVQERSNLSQLLDAVQSSLQKTQAELDS